MKKNLFSVLMIFAFSMGMAFPALAAPSTIQEASAALAEASNGALHFAGTHLRSGQIDYDDAGGLICDVINGVSAAAGSLVRFGMLHRRKDGFSALIKLNLDSFDTSQASDMSFMFCECSSMKALDIRELNTSQVTNMSCMFSLCSSMEALDVSGFDTSQVTNMEFQVFGLYQSK